MEHKERDVDTSHHDELNLGKIGGGRVPKGRGMGISSSTVDGGNRAQGTVGKGTPVDRGDNTNTGLHHAPSTADNAMHQPVGETLGGRNPGQKNAETGDRDRPRGRQEQNDTTVDPMTSRVPDKANEQS